MSVSANPSASFKDYPLRALFSLPANVKKKPRTPDEIRSLAMSIAAHGGLLQNIVVVPELLDGKPTGRAGVAAGETRRLALCLLSAGGIPDVDGFTMDFPVTCKEVPDEEAAAASATENIRRTQMHPADEFEAFRDLFDQCGDVDQVANFFGVKPLAVRQRLKLANASPRLFKLYRDGGMTLEQLMALSITDDHQAQEQVWDAGKTNSWKRDPGNLRAALTQQELSADEPVARFVGVAAYSAAGGRLRQDLFANEDAPGSIIDVALLKQLATDKLATTLATVDKEGWGWVEVRLAPFNERYNYSHASKGRRPVTPQEQERLTELESAIAAADQEEEALIEASLEREGPLEEADDRRLAEIHAKSTKLKTQLNDLERKLEAWTPEVLALAGAVVSIDRNGKAHVDRALVRPQDRKAAAKAAEASRRSSNPIAGTGIPAKGAASATASESESLHRRLTAHRTIALQRVLADNPHVALAALAHSLVQRVLTPTLRTGSALDLQAKGCEQQLTSMAGDAIKSCKAWVELEALRNQWGERLPGDPDKLLPWLIALPPVDLADLLGLCVALTVNAVSSSAIKHQADPLAKAVELDMADWWQPTSDNYLDNVPKSMIAAALKEAGMPEDAASIDKLKKGEAVARAQDKLTGKRWLPKALRRRP